MLFSLTPPLTSLGACFRAIGAHGFTGRFAEPVLLSTEVGLFMNRLRNGVYLGLCQKCIFGEGLFAAGSRLQGEN